MCCAPCVREWGANIFFYTKNGTTIMIDAGYNYDRLAEKMKWLDIEPSSIGHILITHQDADHVGAVERDSDGLFQNATLYLSSVENRYLAGEKDKACKRGQQTKAKGAGIWRRRDRRLSCPCAFRGRK